MEDFYVRRSHAHVPAFGRWDYNDLPFTQCFETVANPEGLLPYSYYGGGGGNEEESDLYVAGDLYENDVVTPAMIVVPRHPKAKKRECYPKVEVGKKSGGGKEGGRGDMVVWDYESYEVKGAPSPVVSVTPNESPPSRREVVPKAIDEDLYHVSPDLFRVQYSNKKQKKAKVSFFKSCLQPTCAC